MGSMTPAYMRILTRLISKGGESVILDDWTLLISYSNICVSEPIVGTLIALLS